MSDETFNAGSVKQVKERNRKIDLRQQQTDQDLRDLLNNPQFRRYIWQVINEKCGLMRTPFNPNGTNQTYFIGRQDVGRELWAELARIDPKVIPQMMLEHHQAQTQEADPT